MIMTNSNFRVSHGKIPDDIARYAKKGSARQSPPPRYSANLQQPGSDVGSIVETPRTPHILKVTSQDQSPLKLVTSLAMKSTTKKYDYTTPSEPACASREIQNYKEPSTTSLEEQSSTPLEVHTYQQQSPISKSTQEAENSIEETARNVHLLDNELKGSIANSAMNTENAMAAEFAITKISESAPLNTQRPDKISQGFKLVSQLENFLRQNSTLAGSEPLRFKDAMGRKFSFPFDICST